MTTRWVRTTDELDDLVDELAGCRAIGIDTEGDSLHHYVEKVCLVQLTAYGGASWLIDPLELRDLSPLAPILADASVLKVVHGGDNDVTSLRRDFGFTFRTMFDTSIAARLLGDAEVGLQALVRNELGVELSKSNQRDDWSKRPLTAKQEAYALADVAHLMALASLPPAQKRTGPDDFRRIKGSAKLSRRQQAVLRELYVWREGRAAAADRPPFKIVGPEVLLELAERSPTSIDEVARALAPYRSQRGEIDVVFEAIQRGLELPEDELPAREKGERTAIPAAARRRIDRLRAWRETQAAESRVDPAIVMPTRVLERIALAGPETLEDLAAIEGIRQWRVAEWGPALLRACG